jgi:probable phosphoglycerate mutase
MAATLWLVRHGATEWSVSGRHTGLTDLPLTDAGETTARALAPVLAEQHFDLVLTSPRLRARRTAALAGFAEATVEDDLGEWDYGDYEGLTTPQIREQVPGWSVWTHPVPGGETADEVGQRLDRVVERVRATGGQALAFAHGHSLRVLAARWLGLPVADGRVLALDTATYSVLGDDRGQPVVERWNVPASA